MEKALALESYLPISNSWTVGRRIKTHSQSKPLRLWFSYILIALNSFLFVSYLVGVNSYSSTGYEIKKLQNRVDSLNEENKKLNLKVTESSSMAQVQDEFINKYFVSVGTPQFLEINPVSTALR